MIYVFKGLIVNILLIYVINSVTGLNSITIEFAFTYEIRIWKKDFFENYSN